VRFREDELIFKVTGDVDSKKAQSKVERDNTHTYTYPDMVKTLGGFKLTVEAG